MVRKQLQQTNPPSTEALYGRAARIDESIRELSLRQFNAGYPLRVRREMTREEEGRDEGNRAKASQESAPSASQPERAAFRRLFHDLAADVATTDAGPGLMALYKEGLDGYVDRAMAALTER